MKFLNQNLLFVLSFQILAEFLSKRYQHHRTTCWKVTLAWSKKNFMSVWHVFVSQLVLSFCLLRSLWQLGSWWLWWLCHLHYQFLYTNLLESQKVVSCSILSMWSFGRSSTIVRCTFTSVVSFWQNWAFCPLLCVGGWSELPSSY